MLDVQSKSEKKKLEEILGDIKKSVNSRQNRNYAKIP